MAADPGKDAFDDPDARRDDLRRVSYNTAAQVGGRLFGAAASLVVLRLSTRYLGATRYGGVVTATAFVLLFTTAADWGLVTIASREMARDPERGSEVLGTNLALRLVGSLVLVPITIGTAFAVYSGRPGIWIGVAVLSPMLVCDALQTTSGAVFVARTRTDITAVLDVGSRLLVLGAVWIVVRGDLGYYAYLWALVAAAAASAGMAFLASRRFVRARPVFSLRAWKVSLLAALPLGIVQVINVVYFKIDSVLLSLFRSSAEVGQYGVAYKVIELIMAIPSFFMLALMPALVVAGRRRFQNLMQQAFDLMATLAVPMGVIGWVLAPGIVALVSSKAFVGGVAPFRALLIGAMASFISAVYGNAIVAIDEQRRLLRLAVVVTVVNVALNLALIPHLGAEGAAAATAATEVLAMVYVSVLFSSITGARERMRQLPKVAIGGAAMVLSYAALQQANFANPRDIGGMVVYALVMTAVYTAALAVFRGLPGGAVWRRSASIEEEA